MPPPRLVANPGTLEERAFDLRPGANTVGRTRENDICLAHHSLSRSHARIDVHDNGVTLTDLGSKNGTFVDGSRIDRQTLGSSNVIRFGEVQCRYQKQLAHSILPPLSQTPILTHNSDADVTRLAIADIVRPRVGAKGSALNLSSQAAAERDRDKLRILLKVSQLLASPASLDGLLNSVLDLAFDILDIDRAAVLMVNERTGELEPRAARSRKGDAAFSRSIARYVMDNAVAALFSDAKADARLVDAGSVYMQSIRTSMCAPLKPRDRVLGALYVDNVSLANRFDAEDLEFLSAFANQVAIAVENSLLSAKLAEEAVTRNNLLRFFPPATVPSIVKAGGAGLQTIEREATVLFADISGYTAMSSRMKPTEIIELLNDYFPVMAEIVFRHDGTLEKYIGDALLAVWGVPLESGNDAERAVTAAIEMQRAIRSLNEGWAGKREIAIHIGINTGDVAFGNIGSKEYIQYAAIGDTTNVASRICGVAGIGETVISAQTAERIRGVSVGLTPLGPVTLRGKAEAQALFRVDST